MKFITHFLLSSILLFVLFWNCDDTTDADTDNIAILSGQVLDASTQDAIENAGLIVLEFPEISGLTNSNGDFTLEIETEVSLDIQIRVFKDEYYADTLSLLAVPGTNQSNIRVFLESQSAVNQPSGSAASIILFGADPNPIGVKESGAPEVSEVSFQVQDSAGVPVDLNNSVQVNFRVVSGPNGGEFINPSSGITASNGLVKTSLFSGTIAGVVQLEATVNSGVNTIVSKPVALTIHGGLPDSTHFSLAVEKLNFPGWAYYGLRDRITAYVGDKYSNPVRPGTPVYFSTTGGIIEGSTFTGPTGEGSVNLISAAPKPVHPVYGPGFATVTGRTSDENFNQIETYAIVLFSGVPHITVSPTTINVPDQGSQSFTFTVEDINGNPMSAGTSISVSVESGDVKAIGNTGETLPDTQSKGWTNFSFVLTDAAPDTNKLNQVGVKISTSGPNGNLTYSIYGTAR
jgi:hypothetical protein